MSFLPNFVNAPVIIGASTTTARTASALPSGWYRVWSDADVHLRQGDSTVDAVTTDSSLSGGMETYIFVKDSGTDDYLAAITDAGTASVEVTRQ